MEGLLVTTHVDGTLVVDSRLIAQELGISHKSLMETIRTYQTTIEQEFGCTRFETAYIQMPKGGHREEISHYWLTEDQATFLGTLSRNTEQVVSFKAHLVKAFSEAKKRLQPSSNPYELIMMLASAGAEALKRVEAVESKVKVLEDNSNSAMQHLKAMPKPTVKVNEMSLRQTISEWIATYIAATNLPASSFRWCWRKAYSHLNRRCHTNITLVQQKRHLKTKLDAVEDLGLMEELYSIVQDLFPLEQLG